MRSAVRLRALALTLADGVSAKGSLLRAVALLGLGVLAGCAAQPPTQRFARQDGRYDPRLGVRASPRLYADGDEIPPGGGHYQVGKPYTVAGKTYYPSERPYAGVGEASWYGSDFHGRLTANGEVFDRTSLSAAHPTMPLPSYARVTNLRNRHSIVVRVNDRGPYHGGRLMDVSERVAEALEFERRGTTHVKIEWLGRAELEGSDTTKLMASLRTDGTPATLNGFEQPVLVASRAAPERTAYAEPPRRDLAEDEEAPARAEKPARRAPTEAKRESEEMTKLVQEIEDVDRAGAAGKKGRLTAAPLPPSRPFDLGANPAKTPAKTAVKTARAERL
jgi:rare lipoprotein A